MIFQSTVHYGVLQKSLIELFNSSDEQLERGVRDPSALFRLFTRWNANVATPLNNFFSIGAMSEVTQSVHGPQIFTLH